MRKKIVIFLLLLSFFPLVALFGCNEKVESFLITVEVNSWNEGKVEKISSTPYKEGTLITLRATSNPKNDGSYGKFITWLFQEETELESDSRYTIKNETQVVNDEEIIVSSELSFRVNKNTQGQYTAIFEDKKMKYVKFDSLYLTTDFSIPPQIDDGSSSPILDASFDIVQSNNSVLTFSESNLSIKDNVLVFPEKKVTNVLKLDPNQAQRIHVDATFNGSYREFDINVLFQPESYTEQNPQASYTRNVSYDSNTKTYLITFNFSYNNQDYQLGLIYKNLGTISTLDN